MPFPSACIPIADALPGVLAAEEAGGSTLVQMLGALGVLLLCFTTLTLLRRRIRRQAETSGLSVQERIRAVRENAQKSSGVRPPTTRESSSAARASVESVMADAEELTRRLAAILDNKAAALEILIDRAEAAAARLEQASAHNPASRAQAPQSPSRFAQPADPLSDEVYALADQGLSALEIARELDEPTGKVELILALRRPTTGGPISAN